MSLFLPRSVKIRAGDHGMWRDCNISLENTRLIYSRGENRRNFIDINDKTVIQEVKFGKFDGIMILDNDIPYYLVSERDDTREILYNALIKLPEAQNEVCFEDFELLSIIGEGFYGNVYLASKKETGNKYALKVIQKSRLLEQGRAQMAYLERNVLISLHHPFIVTLEFSFQTQSCLVFGLEYVSGGDLFRHVHNHEKMKLSHIKFYIAEIACALHYLHSKHIIYRDLKLENVLIDRDGHIKLTDFGLSKWILSTTTTTFCGTTEYLSPEIISSSEYGQEVDWWSLGIMIYEIVFRKTPFYDKNRNTIFKNIRTRAPFFPKRTNPQLVDLIMGLLNKNHENRYGYEQIVNHSFMAGIEWNEVVSKKLKPPIVPSKPELRKRSVSCDIDSPEMQGFDFEGFTFNAN